MTTYTDHALMTSRELATLLQVPIATVYRWRTRGDAPPAFKVGKYVRYRRQDVFDWLDGRRDDWGT
jgi:excisionase family DNA binding protein